MLASATFFVVKAMVRPADGTAAARVPAARADDHDAPRAPRARGSSPSIVQRLRAAVHYGAGGGRGIASRGNRRLGRPAQAD
jgi:hypothetical protein